MSRVEELRARLGGELAVAELEDELVAAKESETDPELLRDLKLRLREARREFRTERAGGAAAAPAPVEVATTVEKGE